VTSEILAWLRVHPGQQQGLLKDFTARIISKYLGVVQGPSGEPLRSRLLQDEQQRLLQEFTTQRGILMNMYRDNPFFVRGEGSRQQGIGHKIAANLLYQRDCLRMNSRDPYIATGSLPTWSGVGLINNTDYCRSSQQGSIYLVRGGAEVCIPEVRLYRGIYLRINTDSTAGIYLRNSLQGSLYDNVPCKPPRSEMRWW